MQDHTLPSEIRWAIKERGRAAATLNPELYSVLEEVQRKFRLLDTSIKERITPLVNVIDHLAAPLATIAQIAPPAVPQIKPPAVPDFLRDFIAAQKGDREAAIRLSKMIPATKKAQREVLTDAILDVLCHTEDALPIYLPSGSRLDLWRDEDGKLKSLTPDNRLLEEVWEWFKIETVNAFNCRSKGEPYFPKVRFSQEPNEENPFPLLLPSESGQLIIKGKAGAPKGSRDFENETDFLQLVKMAIKHLTERRRKVTAEAVGRILLRRLGRLGRDEGHTNPRLALMRTAKGFKPDTNWKELKGRAMQI